MQGVQRQKLEEKRPNALLTETRKKYIIYIDDS